MKNSIELILGEKSWFASYRGPHAEQIERLFDSTIIQTAFPSSTIAESVLEYIQGQNPECKVILIP